MTPPSDATREQLVVRARELAEWLRDVADPRCQHNLSRGALNEAADFLASLSPPNEGMREALEEARETIMRVAYSDHPLRPGENYGSRKARIDRLLAKIDAALSRTGEAALRTVEP